jgi:uncharacterized coiled-coil protein SlyX
MVVSHDRFEFETKKSTANQIAQIFKELNELKITVTTLKTTIAKQNITITEQNEKIVEQNKKIQRLSTRIQRFEKQEMALAMRNMSLAMAEAGMNTYTYFSSSEIKRMKQLAKDGHDHAHKYQMMPNSSEHHMKDLKNFLKQPEAAHIPRGDKLLLNKMHSKWQSAYNRLAPATKQKIDERSGRLELPPHPKTRSVTRASTMF